VWQEHGLTLSVMDYLPMNLVSGRQAGDQVDYFTPVIGTNTPQSTHQPIWLFIVATHVSFHCG
jgi:hypothetical protein